MKRSWKTILTVVLGWGGLGTPIAPAQFQPGGYQPPIQQQPAHASSHDCSLLGSPDGSIRVIGFLRLVVRRSGGATPLT